MCNICNRPITSVQSWHADGIGIYHLLCEFNRERKKLGIPLLKSLGVPRPSQYIRPAPPTASVSIDTEHKSVREVLELVQIM